MSVVEVTQWAQHPIKLHPFYSIISIGPLIPDMQLLII